MSITIESTRIKLAEMSFMNSGHWRINFNDSTAPKDLNMRCKSLSIPYTKINTKSAQSGVHYIENVTLEEEFTMEFYEDVDMSVHNYLLNWRVTLFNNRLKWFNPGAMKKIYASFYRYDAQGKEKEVLKYTFYNTKILGINQYSLTSDANDLLITGASFVADGIGITAGEKSFEDKPAEKANIAAKSITTGRYRPAPAKPKKATK